MSVIFLVLPLALAIVAVAVVAFVWATNRGQYDDLVTPAIRMLHDDEPAGPAPTERHPHGTVTRRDQSP